jgi:hypothetical protein
VWFPKANAIGISWNDFWSMNPHIINLLIKGYKEKEKSELDKKNALYHLLGLYFCESLASTVGNMFKKKGQKPHEYPKKPFDLSKSKEDFTEEELQKQRELFVAKLMAMQANFEINHKDSMVS